MVEVFRRPSRIYLIFYTEIGTVKNIQFFVRLVYGDHFRDTVAIEVPYHHTSVGHRRPIVGDMGLLNGKRQRVIGRILASLVFSDVEILTWA